ncbi:MAG: ribbon-helix-helix domain-containing protein [Candidatus Diapherotrites archaeon]
MDAVSFKLEPSFSKDIKKLMNEFNYSTKTEFIRDALREKVLKLKSELAWRKFEKLRGSAPQKYSEEEFWRLKEEAGEKFLKEFKEDSKKLK